MPTHECSVYLNPSKLTHYLALSTEAVLLELAVRKVSWGMETLAVLFLSTYLDPTTFPDFSQY